MSALALAEPASAKRRRRGDAPAASKQGEGEVAVGGSGSSSAAASGSASRSASSPAPTSDAAAPTRLESLGGALTRALIGTLAFVFRAPVRLFRPVKLSSWTLLEAMAKREGRTLSMRYLRMLVRREQASFLPHLLLPPLLANTAVGFTLFEAYTLTESRLLSKRFAPNSRPDFTPLSIVGVAGFVAGAAQCLVSAPLDNVRLVLSSRRHSRHKGGAIGKALSWRAVIQAALLPFAPSNTRQKLVKAVQAATPTLSTSSSSTSAKSLSAQERRKALAAQLARLRSGVHGAGLLMSLARDSIGFAAFFVVFEVSRRVAYHASRGVDRGIARLNASATLPMHLPYDDGPTRAQDGEMTTQQATTPDLARSRTRSARFVAAFVLVVGGAIGAAIYELVGRPAELMRAVIWQGRKAAERGEVQSKGRKGARGRASAERKGEWERLRGGNRMGETGTRVHTLLAHARATTTHQHAAAQGGEMLNAHAAAASIAASASGSSSSQAVPHARHVPSAAQRRTLGPISAHRRRRLGLSPSAPSSASPPPASAASTSKKGSTSAPAQQRPSAWSLLVQHARRTSRLSDVAVGVAANASRQERTAAAARAPLWRVMGHTYFIAPYVPAPLRAPAPPKPSSSKAATPVRSMLLRLLPPRFQPAPSSLRTLAAAQSWGQGRAAWALRRLASPYGLGFLAYAWLAGDLAP